jgi:hypothetical protein
MPHLDDDDALRGMKLAFMTRGHIGLLTFLPRSAIIARDEPFETVLTPLEAVLNGRTMQWQERIVSAVNE